MAQLDNRRRAYLDAMGIDVWVPAQGVTNPEVEVSKMPINEITQNEAAQLEKPSINEEATAAEATITNEASADVSSMDWSALQTVVSACTLCDLHKTRSQTVFGVGNTNADVLIIGEAPGADEDKQGEPFVGSAGQLLNAMLKAVGFERNDVYIANILKCHPPQNHNPSVEEAEACWAYLKRQIELVQPKIILALGRIAAQRLLKTNTSLARLRGKQHYLEEFSVPVIVTYHPAYLLRAPQEKRKAWEDLQSLISKLSE